MPSLPRLRASGHGSGQTPTPAVKQIGLPLHLSDTDLFTYDSQELARYGVIAFAPAYPLWSDGSGKLRYVRVPLGRSIHFNKDTQEFTIPPNTRFYKTFMKEVVDRGSQAKRYRKIETRLIVSRPDNAPEIRARCSALTFGTRTRPRPPCWVRTQPRGMTTAARSDPISRQDHLLLHGRARRRRDSLQRSSAQERDLCARASGGAAALRATRKSAVANVIWAVSAVTSVLGFTPMQISRRLVNEGGAIEPAGHDEITQLERLIALGVITGVDSGRGHQPAGKLTARRPGPASTSTQRERAHRARLHVRQLRALPQPERLRDELGARSWGRCSTSGPAKLEASSSFRWIRFSPRTSRGAQGRAVPYITPSLYDLLPYGYIPNTRSGAGHLHREVLLRSHRGQLGSFRPRALGAV